jgi:hypothetical protein
MYRPDFFLLKNIFLALAASLLVYATQILCGVAISYRLFFAVGLLTFIAYQFASWYPAVDGYRISFNQSPGRVQQILTLLGAISGVILFPVETLKLLGLPAILTLLYYLHWPSGWLKGGIRAVFLLKNMVVSFVWTYLTYNLPVYPDTPDTLAWVGRFVLVLILTLGLDLRDREADLQRNVKTLPGYAGFESAKRWIVMLASGVMIVFYFQIFPGKISLMISLLATILVILPLKPRTGYWKYFFLLDGILVLYALFLAV